MSLEVSRGQNVLYQMPHDWASIAQFLEPLIARVDAARSELQLLVVTPDDEVAVAIGAAAVRLLESPDTQIVTATSAPRAARLLELRPAQVLTGSASTILELIRGSAIKLDTVRAVCIAWADELLARGEDASLECHRTSTDACLLEVRAWRFYGRRAAGVCLQTTVSWLVCAGTTDSAGVAPSLSATR